MKNKNHPTVLHTLTYTPSTHLSLQSPLNLWTTVALSQTLGHGGREQSLGLARVPEGAPVGVGGVGGEGLEVRVGVGVGVRVGVRGLKGYQIQEYCPPLAVLGVKLHVEQVPGERCHHHVGFLALGQGK